MRAAAAVLALLLVAGCGPTRVGEPFGRPVEPLTPELVRGEQAFMVYCHQCHPGGAAGLGPALNDKPLVGPLVRLQVRTGLGAMPSFGPEVIGDDELDALTDYVLLLGRLT